MHLTPLCFEDYNIMLIAGENFTLPKNGVHKYGDIWLNLWKALKASKSTSSHWNIDRLILKTGLKSCILFLLSLTGLGLSLTPACFKGKKQSGNGICGEVSLAQHPGGSTLKLIWLGTLSSDESLSCLVLFIFRVFFWSIQIRKKENSNL